MARKALLAKHRDKLLSCEPFDACSGGAPVNFSGFSISLYSRNRASRPISSEIGSGRFVGGNCPGIP